MRHPIIARDLRARIESWLPAGFGRVASHAAALRPRVRAAIAEPSARRSFWETLLRGPFRDAAPVRRRGRRGSGSGPRVAGDADKGSYGSVVLVGCGPGDPDLLTLKALQALQDADVLVHDRLVNPAILDYARRDAVRIDVGKAPGGKATPQDEINRILVREALKGQRVARLKGGDAMIFGRAAEEIAAVRAAGVDVEVIPGITAAHAIAASIGLPLTLRGKVRQFCGRDRRDGGRRGCNWIGARWRRPGRRLPSTWACATRATIEQSLLGAGAEPAAPVVIVENGTRPEERAIATTLADLGGGGGGRGSHGARHHFSRSGLGRGASVPPARAKTLASQHRSNSVIDTPHGLEPRTDRTARMTPCCRRRRRSRPSRSTLSTPSWRSSTPLQRSWLAGFLAGLEAAGGQAVQPAAAARPRVPLTLLYGSESGNAEGLALKARKRAQRHGFDARVVDMADADPAALAKAQNLVVFVATWGEGDPPQRAADFYAELDGRRRAAAGRREALPCCRWATRPMPTSARSGKTIDARLEALGGAARCRPHRPRSGLRQARPPTGPKRALAKLAPAEPDAAHGRACRFSQRCPALR